jgi:4-hydroxybenzoate polyprenyltransferase
MLSQTQERKRNIGIFTIVLAYLKLTRPANILTAIADILMGFAAAGAIAEISFTHILPLQNPFLVENLFWLVIATSTLYGGGVVFNDVFDAKLDQKERPERPIPSGYASIRGASIIGALLFGIGILTASQVSVLSFIIAATITLLALSYNKISKHHPVLGPINMGLCRSFNLLLGISCLPFTLHQLWPLALIPLIFIGAITLISQGEVHGGNKLLLKYALSLYILVVLIIMSLNFLLEFKTMDTLPFLILFMFMIFPPLLKSIKSLQPSNIKLAVKAGVLSLIVLNATISAGFAGWVYGLIIICLLPISVLIAKGFAVT